MRSCGALLFLLATLSACVRPVNAPVTAPPPLASSDADPDGDSVPASRDACPDEPGLDPDGCPLRDSDGDGVLDPDDACPQTPECVNGFDDQDGCPDTLPQELAELFGVVESLEFEPDRDTILPASFPELDHIAELLARYPELELEISGHIEAGREGGWIRRRQPTRRRAEAVRDYLIHAGIDPQRLTAKGYGESKPIHSNETPEGREANRRVELEPLAPSWAVNIECGQTP